VKYLTLKGGNMKLKLSVISLSFIIVSVAIAVMILLSGTPTSALDEPIGRGSSITAPEVRQETDSIPFSDAVTRFYGRARIGTIGKIIGGEPAKWNNHKWQAALLVSWIADPAQAQFCGGSLVRQNWVVTAAHCVSGRVSTQDVHVLTGTADLSSGGKRSNVEAIYVHEKYDDKKYNNDIALLKLKDNGVGEPIKPITESEESNVAVVGQNVMITGWGITESGAPSPRLKQVAVPLVAGEKCNGPASYDGRITDKMICAGIDLGGKDSCQGDSGGPNTKDGFLIGIVSWGEGCGGPFKYGVYTRVSQFADWIDMCIDKAGFCKPK
jgi:secreted trypsin-like serine protease